MFIFTSYKHNTNQKDGWKMLRTPIANRTVTLTYDTTRIACKQIQNDLVLCQRSPNNTADERIPLLRIRVDTKETSIMVSKEVLCAEGIYYHFTGKDFIFTPDVHHISESGVMIDENTSRVGESFAFRYIFPPQTIFKNIFRMLLGEKIIFQFSEGCIQNIQTTIDCPQIGTVPTNEHKCIDEIKRILKTTLTDFRPYQPHGALLFSGGVDSMVLYKMIETSIGPIKTYSTSYPVIDKKKDWEKEYAQSAAQSLKTNHTHYTPSHEEYLLGLVEATWENQAPLRMLQSVLVHLLIKNILLPNSIIFTGMAGDTLLGTETETRILFQSSPQYRLLRHPPFFNALKLTSKILGRGYLIEQLKSPLILDNNYRNDPTNFLRNINLDGDIQWIQKYWESDFWTTRLTFTDSLAECDIYQKIFYCHLFGGLVDTESEWSSFTSNGKSLVCPLKTKTLADYALTIPPALKYKEKKYLMKKLATGLGIPKPLIHRRKLSFGFNPNIWATPGGFFDAFLPLCCDYFPLSDIRTLQDPGNMAKAFIFWELITYTIWKKMFIEKVSPEEIKDRIRNEFKRLSSKNK